MAKIVEGPKEVLSELFPEEEKRYPVVEKKEKIRVPPEAEPYLQKIEKELRVIKPVRDGWGRILAQPPTPKKVKITLPITKRQYLAGFHQPLVSSWRWLVEWIKRLLKIWPGGVVFREAKIN